FPRRSAAQFKALPATSAFDPALVEWDPWRPEELARLLARVEAPWYIAAGWAIDLFLGVERRDHEDLEIGVPADGFDAVVEALTGFEPFVIGPGLATPLAQAGDLLATRHQTWVLDPAAGRWRLDVLREPSDGDTWICRRDGRIRLPYEEAIARNGAGIPYARPEIVLLFKGKDSRPKDDEDLADVLPRLHPERRRWLADALKLLHPGHRWLAELHRSA